MSRCEITKGCDDEVVSQSACENFLALNALSPLAIVMLDLSGRVTHWSPAAERLFGWAAVEAIGKVFPIAPERESQTFQSLIKNVADGEKRTVLELRPRRKDGSIVEVSLWAGPVCEAQGPVSGIMGIFADLSERKRVERELRSTNERLEALSKSLLDAQEKERRHIARELHDEIGQALTAVKLDLETMQRAKSAAVVRARIKESLGRIEQILQEVRTLSLDLRPSVLDDLGLVSALRWYLGRFSQSAGFELSFTAEPLQRRLPVEIETACFRVAQEALANAARHAKAGRVSVELRQQDRELLLSVNDDGVGFDVRSVLEGTAQGESFGLLGMEERVALAGGTVEIRSEPGKSTSISVRIPLKVEP